MTIAHRPGPVGFPVDSNHVPYYAAIEVASDAWGIALSEICGDLLVREDLAAVHVDCDFGHELFVGEVDAEVTLGKVGSSSLQFSVDLTQAGRHIGTVSTVLCRVGADRTHSVPLSDPQRAALEASSTPDLPIRRSGASPSASS